MFGVIGAVIAAIGSVAAAFLANSLYRMLSTGTVVTPHRFGGVHITRFGTEPVGFLIEALVRGVALVIVAGMAIGGGFIVAAVVLGSRKQWRSRIGGE